MITHTQLGTKERRFIPEVLTPLAFTEIYRELSDEQRTRYNQLCGLYLLEQTIFFEQCMGRPVLQRIQQIAPPLLREHASEFMEEEDRHTSWFRTLLRECEPHWYPDNGFRLVKAGPIARAITGFCARRPQCFPFLLWLQIIEEERAQYLGGAFVSTSEDIDPRFVSVQRQHLGDEGDHIRWDEEFIQWLWPATPRWLRVANARLLGWLLREFFHLPKRSGWRVVECLIAEFPELLVRRNELRAAMRSLSRNPDFLRTLHPRSSFPRTRRLAQRWPEMRFLETFFSD